MQLDCPLCRRPNSLEPQPAQDADRRLQCAHCGEALVLDRFPGRLMPDPKGASRRQSANKAPSLPVGSFGGFFQSQLSGRRDIPALLFVAVCLLVIAVGGWSLIRAVPGAESPLPRLDPAGIIEQVRDLAKQLIGGTGIGDQTDGHRALARGRAFLQEKSHAEALQAFDKAVAATPNPYEAHFWRGRTLIEMGREADAVSAFEASIASNPRYSHAYDNLGWIHLRRGDYETSLVYLDRSLALRPDNAWAYYNRGRVYCQLGDQDKALQDAEAACRMGFEKACQVLRPSSGEPCS